MATPTISRVRPFMAERGLGTTLPEVLFSDNKTVRFRVLSRDPAAVRAVVEPLPEHDRAVERWLDQRSGKSAVTVAWLSRPRTSESHSRTGQSRRAARG